MFKTILDEIKKYKKIIIHRHSKPDGDALGSQIGLKLILEKNFPEKEIYVVGDMTEKTIKCYRLAGTGADVIGVGDEITVTGKKEVTKIKLSEEVVDPDDIEMLEDLIMAATNEAFRKMEAETQAVMSKLTGGLGGGFPF